MFQLISTGSFKNMDAFLKAMSSGNLYSSLNGLAQDGVAALASATPVDTRLAASSWSYKIVNDGRTLRIEWHNYDIENGFPVVIMLQYGHGTGTGGYVSGRDFINPAIRPIFDRIADHVWKAVTSA